MNKTILHLSMLLALSGAHYTTAQTPFPSGTNVALAKPGMNNAPKNYTIYTSTAASSATFTPGVTFTPTYNINGIGMNPLDNLIYGSSWVGADNTINNNFGVSLHRIGADGTDIDLGLLPTPGQATIEFPNFSAGTVTSEGAYYYTAFGLKPSGAAKVAAAQSGAPLDLNASDLRIFVCWKNDIASLTANSGNNISGGLTGFFELDFSHPDVTTAIENFLDEVNANYPNIYNADGGIQDIAIHPLNLNIYGYISYPESVGGATVGRPVVVTPPVAGMATVTPVGTVVNNLPGQEVAGLQFDASGNFYGLFTTGDYAQIDLATGALSSLTPSNIATTGGNLRGDLASAITNVPFPVQLVFFKGSKGGSYNELYWLTATEKNNKGFELERSADNHTWSNIGFIAGKGGTGEMYYSYTDRMPLNSNNYYRLKMVDNDGQFRYSTTVILSHAAENHLRTYPSPAKDKIYIEGADADTRITLTDINGKALSVQQAMAGGILQIDLTAYPAGMYFITETSDKEIRSSVKIIKE